MKLNTAISLVLVFFVCPSQMALSYNILFMLPFGSQSHRYIIDPIAEELGKRGHKVVIFSTVESKIDPPGVTSVLGRGTLAMFEKRNMTYFQESMNKISSIANIFQLIYDMCDEVFMEPFVVDLVKQPIDPLTNKPKYDVVVIDAVFNDMTMVIGHRLGVPNILLSPSTFLYHQLWHLNVPHPISYIPCSLHGYPDPMDFINRALNAFSRTTSLLLLNYVVFPNADEIIRKYVPNAPPLVELHRNVSFMMSNTHPAIHVRQPGMPYTAEIGGINCKQAKPLPKDFEDFMQGAGKDGVIYFSLGSRTPGDSMPLEMRDKVISVFSKLPQSILWKYEKDIPELPGNIKLVKWAPQQDILAHPQLRLFITYGGLLSTTEAAYHGCPVLGFPLSADQIGNMVQVRRFGLGDYLSWQSFTTDEFREAIDRLINNKGYKEKSMMSSVLLKDTQNRPVDVAVYWIEYVIRHKGAHFLKSSANHLNFFQYFLLDVLAVVIVTLIMLAVMLFYITKYMCKYLVGICRVFGLCSKSAAKKTKNKKNN